MLDSIRDLTSQLKLKTLILDNFVPKTCVADIEARAVWNKEKGDWDLPKYVTTSSTCLSTYTS